MGLISAQQNMAKADKIKIDDYTKKINTNDDIIDSDSLLQRNFLDRKIYGGGGLVAKGSLPDKGYYRKIGWSEIIDDNNLKPSKMYDAIVAKDGSGQYIQIQDAIDAGKKRIYVRSGTYYLNRDITLDSNVIIIGEDRDNTIIDFNGNDHQILLVGTGFYNTGTITVTINSTTITGLGTSWLANLSAGDYIIFNGQVCLISSVDSNTQLTIDHAYQGATTSGLSYLSGDYKSNVQIQNLTLKHHTITGGSAAIIKLWYVFNVYLNNLKIIDNDTATGDGSYGIQFYYSSNCIATNIIAEDNEEGIEVLLSEYMQFLNLVANNNYCGILDSQGKHNEYTNIFANNNETIGLYLINNENCSFINSITNYNNSSGTYITGAYNKIVNLESAYNGYNGILFSSSYTEVVNCHIHHNTTFGLYATTSFYTLINNCIIELNNYDGLAFDDSDHCVISNNLFKDNGQGTNNTYSEISLGKISDSDYNTISNNNIYCQAVNKAKYGIREETSGCNYNTIIGNTVVGPVTEEISVQGMNTSWLNNIPSDNYRAITALRTLDATDYLIDCTANTFTVTLPTAVGITGRVYIIKNTGTGVITVDGNSSETIDGVTTQTLNQWDSMTISSNGSNWIIN